MTSLAYGIDWIAAEKSGERELQRLPKRQRHELCQVHSWLSGSVALKQYQGQEDSSDTFKEGIYEIFKTVRAFSLVVRCV